jgi:hypothetical protein
MALAELVAAPGSSSAASLEARVDELAREVAGHIQALAPNDLDEQGVWAEDFNTLLWLAEAPGAPDDSSRKQSALTALDALPARESQILKRLLGYDGEGPDAAEDVAADFGVSVERGSTRFSGTRYVACARYGSRSCIRRSR